MQLDGDELKPACIRNYQKAGQKKEKKEIDKKEADKKTTFYVDKSMFIQIEPMFQYIGMEELKVEDTLLEYMMRNKKGFYKEFKTSNRIAALAAAQNIYAENKERLRKGVKFVSLTTKELCICI